jgi:hypothetical protein
MSLALGACKVLEAMDWLDHVSVWYLVASVLITVVSGCVILALEDRRD